MTPWAELWESIPESEREGWRTPWMSEDGDGNPAFTAVSGDGRHGVRILTGPISSRQTWTDKTMGGVVSVVIFCSETSKDLAWAKGRIQLWLKCVRGTER